MVKFFQEHAKGVTHNLIANLLILAGGGAISWYTANQAIIAGIPRYLAILIGVGVFSLLGFTFAAIAFGVSRFRAKEQKPDTGVDQPEGNQQRQIGNLESELARLRERDRTWGAHIDARDEDIDRLSKQCLDLGARLTDQEEQLKGVERERDALRVELDKRQSEQLNKPQLRRADIRGEIREGSFVAQAGNIRCRVRIRTIFYNRGELTTLRTFRIRVSHPYYGKTWESGSIRREKIADDMPNLADMLNRTSPFELVPGIHHDGWLLFEMRNEAQSDELFDPMLIVTDGFGDDHEIPSKLKLRRTR